MGWKYNFGLVSIFFVVVIWVSSAEISQGVFNSYKHPFVVTYIGTSMLLLHLPIALIQKLLIKHWITHFSKKVHKQPPNIDQTNPDHIKSNQDNDIEQQRQSSARKNDGVERPQSSTITKPECEADERKEEERKMNTKEVVVLAFCLGPLWFMSEYLTSCALAQTSVASSTILFSTSGMFTLLIDACFKRSINVINLASVTLSLAGVAITANANTWDKDSPQLNEKHSLVGDAFALVSAFTDGLYYVLLKNYAGENGQKLELQKYLGFVGLMAFTGLWWLVWPLTALGIEPKFASPKSAKVIEIIAANSILGNFVADYFWAIGAMWTSPLVSALGDSVSIPVAMLADMIIHGRHYSLLYIFGSIQVFVGFIVANLSEWLTSKWRLKECKLRSMLFENGEAALI